MSITIALSPSATPNRRSPETVSAETVSSETTSSEITSSETASSPNASSPESSLSPSLSNPHAPLPAQIWKRLTAPFSRAAHTIIGLQQTTDSTSTIAQVVLRREAIEDRLDAVLGRGGYAFVLEPLAGPDGPGLLCHLIIGGTVRSGIGHDKDLQEACEMAFRRAAAAFGIGRAADRMPTQTADVDLDLSLEDPDAVTKCLHTSTEPALWTPDE